MNIKYLIFSIILVIFLNLAVNSQICNKVRKVPVTVIKTRVVPHYNRVRNWFGRIQFVLVNKTERYTDVIQSKLFNFFFYFNKFSCFQIEYREEFYKVCCEGFKLSGWKCIPNCDVQCLNGYCTGPNQCTCRNGYIKYSTYW